MFKLSNSEYKHMNILSFLHCVYRTNNAVSNPKTENRKFSSTIEYITKYYLITLFFISFQLYSLFYSLIYRPILKF